MSQDNAWKQQPAPSGDLETDQIAPMAPTNNPPATGGAFSDQRQAQQKNFKGIISKKIAGANTARPLEQTGSPASKRLPKKTNDASTIAGSVKERYKP